MYTTPLFLKLRFVFHHHYDESLCLSASLHMVCLPRVFLFRVIPNTALSSRVLLNSSRLLSLSNQPTSPNPHFVSTSFLSVQVSALRTFPHSKYITFANFLGLCSVVYKATFFLYSTLMSICEKVKENNVFFIKSEVYVNN